VAEEEEEEEEETAWRLARSSRPLRSRMR